MLLKLGPHCWYQISYEVKVWGEGKKTFNLLREKEVANFWIPRTAIVLDECFLQHYKEGWRECWGAGTGGLVRWNHKLVAILCFATLLAHSHISVLPWNSLYQRKCASMSLLVWMTCSDQQNALCVTVLAHNYTAGELAYLFLINSWAREPVYPSDDSHLRLSEKHGSSLIAQLASIKHSEIK